VKYISVCLLGLLLFALTLSTQPVQAQVCAGYRTLLAVGRQGTVAVARLNLRPSAGTTGAPLVELRRGMPLTVVGGPTCAETLTWWQVQAAGQTGWVAEENSRGRLVNPTGGEGAWQAPQPLPPSPEIAGASNSGGGNNQVDSLCESNYFGTDVQAFRRVVSADQANGSGQANSLPLTNGEFVTLTEFDLTGVLNMSPVVELCAASVDQLAGAFAVSAAGETIPVEPRVTQNSGYATVALPPQALTQPGTWTLNAGGFNIPVSVPTFTRPTYNFLCCDGSNSSYTLLLGGFQPNERVIIMQTEAPLTDDRLNLNNFVVSEVQTDSAGYYLNDLTTPFSLGGMMLFVGEQGSFTYRSFFGETELADARSRIVNAYLSGAPLPEDVTPVANTGNGLDLSLPPQFGSDSLAAGFVPDPYTFSLTSGGAIEVGAGGYGQGCIGYATSAPSFSLHWSGTSGLLQLYFLSEGDTTLIVNDAHGNWWCSDDSNSTVNPLISIASPPEGRYDIWVGSYSAGEQLPGTLYITEIESNHP
jgi:hypothetical protein